MLEKLAEVCTLHLPALLKTFTQILTYAPFKAADGNSRYTAELALVRKIYNMLCNFCTFIV